MTLLWDKLILGDVVCVLSYLQLIYTRYTQINKSDLKVKVLNHVLSPLVSPPEASFSLLPSSFSQKDQTGGEGGLQPWQSAEPGWSNV